MATVQVVRTIMEVDSRDVERTADQWAEVAENIGIAEDEARDLNQQFNRQRGIIEDLEKKEKELVEQRRRSNDPRQIRRINRELEQTRGRIRSVTGETRGLSSQFKGLVATLATAATAAAAFSFGKNAVEAAADFEALQISFETFLGSANEANKVLADLEKFSISTPFTPDQVQNAGRALLAFGEPVDSLTASLKQIGDIAAGTGKDFNELSTIYGKARVAGTLYAEDINQLIEAGVPILDEFAEILGVSASEVKGLASEGQISFGVLQQAFANMTNEGGRFAGLTEKLAKSTSGQISTLQGNFANLARTIGKVLLPAVTSVVGFFNRLLSGSQDVTQSYRDQIVELERTRASLDILVPQLKDTTLTENERAAVIKQINTIYPDLNEKIDLQTASEQELDAALKDVNKTISKNIELLQFQAAQALALERLNESLKQNADSVVKLGALFSDVSDEAALRELFGHEQAAAFEAFTGSLDGATAKLALVRDELRKAGALDATLPLEERVNALDDALGKLPATVEFASGGVVDSLRGLVEEFRSGRAGVSGFSEILQTIQGQAADAGLDLDGLADSAKETNDPVTEQVGLLERLRGEMKALREEQDKSQSPGRIRAISNEIDALQKRITALTGTNKKATKAQEKHFDIQVDSNRELIEEERVRKRILKIIQDEQSELDKLAKITGDTAVPAVDNLNKKIAERLELRKREKEEEDQRREDILKGLAMTLETGQNIAGLMSALSQRRIAELDKEQARQLELAGENAEQREKIEEQFAAKRTEILRKQAEQDKARAIFETIINTAAAIAKAGANIPLAIFAGVQGALQLATIAAQPIPFFHGGLVTDGVEHRDSVPAMLRKGEFVLTPDQYRGHKALIDSIYAGRPLLSPEFGNSVVVHAKLNDKRILASLDSQTDELRKTRIALLANRRGGSVYRPNNRRGY